MKDALPFIEAAGSGYPCESTYRDFFDAEKGLAYWNKRKTYNSAIYAAFAKIRIFISCEDCNSIDKFKEFIKSLFAVQTLSEHYDGQTASHLRIYTFTLYKPFDTLEGNAEKWLTCCTLLNTYCDYFINASTTGIAKTRILCGINAYDDSQALDAGISGEILSDEGFPFTEDLAINDIVYESTVAKNELAPKVFLPLPQAGGDGQHKWYAYNFLFDKLSDALKNSDQ